MNMGHVEATARKAWDNNPVLQYAFHDFGAFLQTQMVLSDSRDDVLRQRIPSIMAAREVERAAASQRMALVQSPGDLQAPPRFVERQGNRLVIWIYGRLTDGHGIRIAEALFNNRDAASAIFRISSGGGLVGELTQIQDAIVRFPGRTVALVDHFGFSAAADLAIVCDRLIMRRNAVIMFHRMMETITGNCDELLQASRALRTEDDRMTNLLYITRRKASLRVIREATNSARYIGADEALSLGLADAIAPALLGSDEVIANALPQPEANP